MQALISPNEIVYLPDGATGQRVAQVEPDDKIFPVAEPLFWMPCDASVVADQFYYDGRVIRPIPQPDEPSAA